MRSATTEEEECIPMRSATTKEEECNHFGTRGERQPLRHAMDRMAREGDRSVE